MHLLVVWYLVNLQDARCNNKAIPFWSYLYGRVKLSSPLDLIAGQTFHAAEVGWIYVNTQSHSRLMGAENRQRAQLARGVYGKSAT